MEHTVPLLMTGFVTHDVKRFVLSKPEGFDHLPGQGVEIAIDDAVWRDKKRPFTPTSLRDDRVLEFTIKRYPDHHGVTDRLHTLKAGDRLLMSEPFGTITYRGPGTFIAGGAGVTPFIAILRQLAAEGRLDNHSLIVSNKTAADIICEKEFRHYLGPRATFLCTRESSEACLSERIDADFLQRTISDFGQHFYVCGPPSFVSGIREALTSLGADSEAVIFEK